MVRIIHPAGKPTSSPRAISDWVHEALCAIFNVPADDLFQTLSDHAAPECSRSHSYLGIHYSDDLTLIQVTRNEGRILDMKKARLASLADRLSADPGPWRADIVINRGEVKKENGSFGNGVTEYAQ